jgi:hypothetical protein
MNKIQTFILTYHQVYIVFSMINLYCHGPIYHYYTSVLTPEMIELNIRTANALIKTNQVHRKLFHDLYKKKPRSQEALDSKIKISMSKNALNAIIQAFDIALLEAEKSNFYHLEIILNTPVSEIIKCLNTLKQYRQECICTESLNDLKNG